MSTFIHRVTYLMYTLFSIAIVLLCLSIATVILQSKVLHVFRNLQVQIPGSALVEWAFISLDPANLDSGSAIATVATATCGVLSAVAIMTWTRVFGFTTCVILLSNTGASVALTTYIFITEAGMKLPERFRLWGTTEFTLEFYICTAFPSIIPDAREEIYGFPACEDAKSARFLQIGVTVVSALLAGLAIWQAWRSGIVRMFMYPGVDLDGDAEESAMGTMTLMSRPAAPTPRMVMPTRVHAPETVRRPRETRQGVDRLPLMVPVPMPDLEDYYYEEENEEKSTGYPRDRKAFVCKSLYGFYAPL